MLNRKRRDAEQSLVEVADDRKNDYADEDCDDIELPGGRFCAGSGPFTAIYHRLNGMK